MATDARSTGTTAFVGAVPPAPDEKSGLHEASAVTKKNASSLNAALVKDALNPKLSAVEATSQLKVLCRKFAALTEKVKEETRIREEAEKEVRRLRAIIESNKAPVVASCRAEAQVYMNDLKDAQESLKQELRLEKEKNAKLVSKALELEREKSQLLNAACNARDKGRPADVPPSTDEPHPVCSSRPSTNMRDWDREQTNKIHETMRMTIDELQDELTRKDEELASYRERSQRERSRIKALEVENQEREEAARDEQGVLRELEASIQEQRDQFEAIEKDMQLSDERLEEEQTLRRALEQQIETLNEVNTALDQRSKTLVRRLELNQSVVQEMDELKLQVRDAEVDKETLVRSIKDVKAQHYLQEVQWRAQLEQLRTEKLALASQIADLQSEITSLRTQNAMFSEWMLVRSENVAAAQQQQQQQQQQDQEERYGEYQHYQTAHRPLGGAETSSSSARARVRPLTQATHDGSTYVHTSLRCPLSPSNTRSMTTASPIIQHTQNRYQPSRRTSVSSSASSSVEDDRDQLASSAVVDTRRRYGGGSVPTKPPPPKSSAIVAATATARSTKTRSGKSSKLTDHERLRELMTRNRELQNRLQQETVATRNLEQEISHISSTRMDKFSES